MNSAPLGSLSRRRVVVVQHPMCSIRLPDCVCQHFTCMCGCDLFDAPPRPSTTHVRCHAHQQQHVGGAIGLWVGRWLVSSWVPYASLLLKHPQHIDCDVLCVGLGAES